MAELKNYINFLIHSAFLSSVFSFFFVIRAYKHTQREPSAENIFRLKCSKDVWRANFTMQLNDETSFPFNFQSLNPGLAESIMITFW
jgi:hypothetical protein